MRIASTSHPEPQAWRVFAMLFALMVVDYVDRQVVVSLFPLLKTQWKLSDTQLGSLASAVPIAVAAGTLPISLLADRWSRVKCVFIMVLVWSLAALACAFASSYAQLLAARAVVGLGEAAYGTAGAAMLAGLFPSRMRSTVLGAFLAAAVLGSVLGVMLGGIIAERWGWQAAFGVVALPGLGLAFVFLVVARGVETSASAPEAAPAQGVGIRLLRLLRSRTALFCCAGGALQLLVIATTYAWLPSYLNRYHAMAPGEAGARTSFVVLLGGVGAVLLSVLADRLVRRVACARLYVCTAVAIATTLLLCVAFGGLAPGSAQFALIAAGGLIMTGILGPVAATVSDVTDPRLRATAISILALAQSLLGLAGGPILSGVLADAYGLHFAMSVLPAFSVAAAALFVLASRSYVQDMRGVGAAGQGFGDAVEPRPA